MTTYEFYKTLYLGNQLEEEEFPQAIARAEAYVAFLERQYRATAAVENGRDMALCAVADMISRLQKQENVSSATVGNVSVRYFAPDLAASLRRAVEPYLQLHRGVD